MAGLAVAADIDAQQQRVLIAIDADFDHMLHLSRSVALAPEFLARARPVMRHAGLQSLFQREGVHVGEHQDFAAGGFCRDADDQAVGVEFRREGVAFFEAFLVGGGSREGHGGLVRMGRLSQRQERRNESTRPTARVGAGVLRFTRNDGLGAGVSRA